MVIIVIISDTEFKYDIEKISSVDNDDDSHDIIKLDVNKYFKDKNKKYNITININDKYFSIRYLNNIYHFLDKYADDNNIDIHLQINDPNRLLPKEIFEKKENKNEI
jgi:hypothetical protein